MSNYDLKLSTTQPNHVEFMEFRQDDILSRTLNVAITSHDLPRDLTGYDVFLNSTLPSRNIARDKVTNFIDKANGKLSYTLIDSFVQDTGRVAVWFSIEKGGSTTQVGEVIDSTTNFTFSVVPGYRNCVKQGNYIWEFEELLRYVKGLASQAQEVLNKISSDVEVMQKQIDDMFALIASQGVLSANDVKQLMIKFMSGEDIEVTDVFDFTGKIAGSNIENPHNFYYGWNEWTTLMLPSASWGDGAQNHYASLQKVDGNVVTTSRTTFNVIAQGRAAFNFLAEYKKRYPNIFKATNTDAENLILIKSKLTSIEPRVYAKGSSFAGNKVSAGVFSNTEGTWWLMGRNTTADIAKISSIYSTANQISYLLNPQGIVNLHYYAEAATQTVPSIAILDYADVKVTTKFNIRDFIPTPRFLNAKDYGIKGDGVTNDTAAIQALINRMVIGDTLYFFPGTFMIDAVAAKKLIWKSNINIEISPQATLKVISNNAGNYELFDLSNLSNIRIYGGGRLLGERSTHTGTAGEWGMGVMMKKSANIKIEDIRIDDFWGDGVYIGGDKYGNQSKNIYLKNVNADNNRRQGFSVVNVDGLIINGGSATRTNGTAPESGIDFEPNNNGEMLRNITISNFTTSENAGGSMLFAHAVLSTGESNLYPLTDNQISIRISNLYSYKDARGPYLTSDAHTVFKLNGFIEFNNTTILEPLKQGVWFNNWREEHMAKVRFNNLSVTDVNSNGLSQGTDAVAMLFSSGGTTDWATETNRISYSGVSISNLSVIDTRATQKTEIGVRMICEAYQLQNAQITNYDTNLPESKKLSWLKGRGTIKYINETGYKISSGTQVVDTVKYFGQTLMTQNGNGYLLPPSKEHVGKEIGFRIPIQGAGRFPVIRLTSTSDSFTGCGVLVKTTNGMVLSGNTGNEIRFKSVEDDQWLITYLGEAGTFKQQ